MIEGALPRAAATVAEVNDVIDHRKILFQTIAALAVEQAAEDGVDLQVERRAGPLTRLLRQRLAEDPVDVVVIGRPSRGLLDRVGLTAQDRISRHAPCWVLTVR